MRLLRALSLGCLACTALAATAAAGEEPAYRLELTLDPAAQTLAAKVRLTVPAAQAGQAVEFLLAKPLQILESEPAAAFLPFDRSQGFSGINGSSFALAARDAVARYRVQLAPGEREVRLAYRGRIDFPLDTQAEEYTRGFRETPGLVSTEGVYLAGSTLWYPFLGEALVRFELTSNVPEGWHLVSQGNGSSRDEHGRAHWDSGGAVDEIYLVGGPLVRYAQSAGAAEAQVYLRKPEEPLARRYLAATGQYIEMYRRLIGPYPYEKFALVENFWETGYGMPSFTLLGSQIIRFPFILTSSYPHEILHNWWGNSVFVDYATGNWCEGLTAYMADHLIKEQGGLGAEFRRDTLKKYRDYVREGRDFPLTEFRSRHSAATEAVGYGKTLMLFHMLRVAHGDEAFRKALARFYRNNRGKRASFADVRREFEAVTGAPLASYFAQWVQRTGAPRLEVIDARVSEQGTGFRLQGELVQRQPGAAYDLAIPLHVTTAQGLHVHTVRASSKAAAFAIELPARPLLLEVDPEFDLFRLLDPRETAPSIGQVFGEPAILAVLPSAAAPEVRAAYRRLMEGWRSDAHRIEIVTDETLAQLPEDRAVWLLGRENRLAAQLFASDPAHSLTVTAEAIRIGAESIPFEGHSAVLIRRHPRNVGKAVGWIAIDPLAAFEGFARKLPHYGKYSYLGFAGTEPANTVKGEWTSTDSPLRIDLRAPALRASGPVQAAQRPKRAALAELPPMFSAEALRGHVEHLASPELEGRGVGTAGLAKAAEYIAAQFRAAGLQPAAPDFLQSFPLPAGPDGKPHLVQNVVGFLPAGEGGHADQAVLITAHYDHLGRGWPSARAGEAGQVHPGADDNASGVAVLLELAKAYATAGRPKRNLVFVAFSAEEAGLRGSRHYAEHPLPVPLAGIRAVVNLDTVGRLGDNEISVLAAASATEWPHIFRGVGFTTGLRIRSVEGAAQSSDQQSFIDKGIPAVQLFTGAHLDYHRPSDTAEKIDVAGMVEVATAVREAVDYLLEREAPLTFVRPAAAAAPGGAAAPAGPTAPAGAPAPPGASGAGRRVSLGTVPDFGYTGRGVRIDSVVPGSGAAAAGLAGGDVIVALDDREIPDLQAYSDFLKTRAPGVTVRVTVQRGGERLVKDVALAVR